MNNETLTALVGSIEKWTKIRAGELEDHRNQNCPLCSLFYDDDCEGCPVMAKSKERYCRNTPYKVWADLCYDTATWTADTTRKKAQATREINFLKSLLP